MVRNQAEQVVARDPWPVRFKMFAPASRHARVTAGLIRFDETKTPPAATLLMNGNQFAVLRRSIRTARHGRVWIPRPMSTMFRALVRAKTLPSLNWPPPNRV